MVIENEDRVDKEGAAHGHENKTTISRENSNLFDEWVIKKLKYPEYLYAFKKEGCDRLENILDIDEEFLKDDLKISKKMHVKFILRQVKAFKDK